MNLLRTKAPASRTLLLIRPARTAPGWLASHEGHLITAWLSVVLLWSYWPILGRMIDQFWRDPQYSHGFLVPLFALFLLWQRRENLQASPPAPSLWGLLLLEGGVAMRLAGSRPYFWSIDAFSLLPTLAGMVALVGGRQMLRWSWPAIAFLGFMMPPPDFVTRALSQPLRRLATVMSTFLLETMGFPALADGNVILLDEVPLKVADACSGLGMLVTFFTMSTALAMLLKRGWLDKVGIVCSAIPIAVLANVLRITATGVAQMTCGRQAAHLVMHDLAGWLMMPLALALLGLYVWLADRIFPRVDDSAPLMIPGLKTNL